MRVSHSWVWSGLFILVSGNLLLLQPPVASAQGARPSQVPPAQAAPAQGPQTPQASPAVTPAPADEPAGYRATVEEARREYDRGNFVEARALFAKANSVFPNARALRGLGMTLFELKSYGECVSTLEEALASKVRPLDGELRTETTRLLDRARSFVGRIHVSVEPPETTITVDGMPTKLDAQGNLLLEIGAHVLEFHADGHTEEKRGLKIIGGEQESLHVALRKQSPAPAPLLVAATAEPVRTDAPLRPLYKNPWLWTGVGVAAAAVATGLVLGLSGGGGGTQDPPVSGTWEVGRVR